MPVTREEALKRSRNATQANSNFWSAQDLHWWQWPMAQGRGRTCLLTSTGFYGLPVASNEAFVKTPEQYGFEEITYDKAQPGDIIILSDKNNKPTHATIFDGVSNKRSISGAPLLENINVGDTLVNYSNGNRGENSYRLQQPIKVFNGSKAGGDFSGVKRYFKAK